MTTIIYLHGFASVGNSAKSQAISAAFPDTTVIAPDLPVDPDQVIEIVTGLVDDALKTHPRALPLIFVGTSLGGFWANYFAHQYHARAVLVNPSLQPSQTLYAALEKLTVNHKTGEPVTVTEQDLWKFDKLEDEIIDCPLGDDLVDVFLAKDDDVIPWQRVMRQLDDQFRNCTITESGGHRYDTEWNRVVEKIDEIIKQSV